MSAQRFVIKNLYKQFMVIGKEYPEGPSWVRERVKRAFLRNKNETDQVKIEELIKKAEYIIKEMETLIQLKKYRTLKRVYGEEAQEAILPEPPT